MIIYKKIWWKFYWYFSLNAEDISKNSIPKFPIKFIWKNKNLDDKKRLNLFSLK